MAIIRLLHFSTLVSPNPRSRVLTRSGVDVTGNFLAGAEQVMRLARELQVVGVFLKSGSPSCGAGRVLGVTAALLRREGFVVREF